jgi:ATP-binding cassette subfamily B protein
LARDPFRPVFAFCLRQWRREMPLTVAIALAMLLSTICEAVIPLFAGRLVDALTPRGGGASMAIHAVLSIFALGLVG